MCHERNDGDVNSSRDGITDGEPSDRVLTHCEAPGPFPGSAITRPRFRWGGLFLRFIRPMASTDWSNDATRWNAGQLALVEELSGDHVTIRPCWAANYAMLLVACLAGSRLPGPVIDHWAFNGEDASILVNDDQEEWRRGFVHITELAYLAGAFIPLSRLGGAGLDRARGVAPLPQMKRIRNPGYGNLCRRQAGDGPMLFGGDFGIMPRLIARAADSVRRRLGAVRLQRSL